ncbi:ATP-binding cassette domain-containing protein [Ramlibacter albus]|uniref:ATP-binding cassette domain-containing protein n=1 Tax=Ramlibacter albus TaxID=2079448 RepID=A0A923MDM9_9BURK|nr:ATP-binding cassette domain-containing protein [Ramlibacter albus]MBC5768438.1 ATP-binding cassette domain-containing protein [Ramlibacter albus]
MDDARADEFLAPHRPNWLLAEYLRHWPSLVHQSVGAFATNCLALAGSLFSMQMFDRVIPAQSLPTLWMLALGVLVAVGFSLLIKLARTHSADQSGKKTDLAISSHIYSHALALRLDARPRSTGSFMAQLREIDAIRELVTSTSTVAVIDIPFAAVFVFILYLIGGPAVALVALCAIPLVAVPGIIAQWPMARLARAGSRTSALRNAVLVESIEGIEDIKALRAQERFESLWNACNADCAQNTLRSRFLASGLLAWTQETQQLVWLGIMVTGAYQVMGSSMTTGALTACSILGSRAISPFAQLGVVFGRWQQARVAKECLDDLMRRPVDAAARSGQAARDRVEGALGAAGLEFRYVPDAPPVLAIDKLEIRAGEKVALVGQVGAGKSTLLRVLSGLLQPTRGAMALDGTDYKAIRPADLRRHIAYMSQESRLFYGTIRDNLALGRADATDEEMLAALRLAGAEQMAAAGARTLDIPIFEGGQGMSSGQRQFVLLARTLISQPQVLMLDEPTSNMDEAAETLAIARIREWVQPRTLVLVTHRVAALQVVDRICVVDGGRIVLDGARDHVLALLSGKARPPAAQASPADPAAARPPRVLQPPRPPVAAPHLPE